MSNIRDEGGGLNASDIEIINGKRLVFIVDEAHRSTFGDMLVSSLYEVFKTSEDVDDRLLWHWFKSPDFQKLIMQLQEGGVRLYFYYDKLCMGEVSLPLLEEQRKIGKLFDTLDNLITLHQRKPFLMKWRTSDANRNQTNRLVL